MSFGYIGDTSTSVKQQVKNKGILTTQESFDLERQGFLGGSLELIEEQTVTNASAVDFTSIKQDIFDVHFMTVNNFQPASDNHYIAYRLYESGVLETGSVYMEARQFGLSSGSFGEAKGTSASLVTVSHATGTDDEETNNTYIFFHDLGNSSRFSFSTSHSTGMSAGGTFGFEFAGAVLPQASTVDGIRILTDQGSNIEHATVKLYGLKQI